VTLRTFTVSVQGVLPPVTGFTAEDGYGISPGPFAHGTQVTISGTGFGSGPAAWLFDTIDNQSAWASFTEGQLVTAAGPYLGPGANDPPPTISFLRPRHSRQTKNYRLGQTGGCFMFPDVLGGQNPPASQTHFYLRMFMRPDVTPNPEGVLKYSRIRERDSNLDGYLRGSWPTDGFQYRNTAAPPDDRYWGPGTRPTGGQWGLLEEWATKPFGTATGKVRCYLNNSVTVTIDDNYGSTSNGITATDIGWDVGNTALSNTGWYMGELYCASSRARVVLSSAATYSAITNNQEICEPVSWSGTQVVVNLNLGQFASASGLYLFLVTHDDAKILLGRFT
jgi:hypothetical protein